MPIYAILRVAKLKGAGKCTAAGEHLERTRATPNADPARLHLNRRLAGSGDLWADIKARLDPLPTRPKSNAVHALELLLSASPAYFADGDPAALAAWVKAAGTWAHARFGARNVVAAVLHRDEETPHLHVVIVPIVEKAVGGGAPGPRLCARDITGGRYRLSKLQDHYAAAVAHLGIVRGVRGARIEYEHLHQRYADMTGTPPAAAEVVAAIAVQPPRWAEMQDVRGYAAGEGTRLRAAVLPLAVALAARCEELERRAAADERRLAALQAELREANAVAARGGAVDLGWLLGELGGVRDPHDPHRWRLGGDTISLDGQRYRDLTQRQEGAGAMELLAHATGCDHQRALAFLAQRGGAGACMAAVADEAARRVAPMAERALGLPAVELVPLRRRGHAEAPAAQAPEAGPRRAQGGVRSR